MFIQLNCVRMRLNDFLKKTQKAKIIFKLLEKQLVCVLTGNLTPRNHHQKFHKTLGKVFSYHQRYDALFIESKEFIKKICYWTCLLYFFIVFYSITDKYSLAKSQNVKNFSNKWLHHSHNIQQKLSNISNQHRHSISKLHLLLSPLYSSSYHEFNFYRLKLLCLANFITINWPIIHQLSAI